jgi:hypothetical protein
MILVVTSYLGLFFWFSYHFNVLYNLFFNFFFFFLIGLQFSYRTAHVVWVTAPLITRRRYSKCLENNNNVLVRDGVNENVKKLGIVGDTVKGGISLAFTMIFGYCQIWRITRRVALSHAFACTRFTRFMSSACKRYVHRHR